MQSPSATPCKVYPTHVGPTPQKDGIPLGLFDLLSPHQNSHFAGGNITRPALSSLSVNVPSTPSKRPHSAVKNEEAPDTISHTRFTRTPTSIGKRFLFDSIVTPFKGARDPENYTPSSSAKHLQTPAFLRRDVLRLDTLPEDNEVSNAQDALRVSEPPFKKRKGIGRSLSAIIRGLRKQEDEEFADEMEVQREMEMEVSASYSLAQVNHKPDTERRNGNDLVQVLVEDSQVVMPLGPDGQSESDGAQSDDSEREGDGKVRKVWKKKGSKRQTKRLNSEYTLTFVLKADSDLSILVRPVASKPKVQSGSFPWDDDADAHSTVVPESQATLLPNPSITRKDPDSDYGGGYIDEVPSDAEATRSRPRKKSSKPTASMEHSEDTQPNPPKKSKPKANPQAHANYRKLKIKSKFGQGQGRTRFGRGRR